MMLKKEKQNTRWAEKVRQSRGRLTQAQFAQKLGVSVATVRNWEYGRQGGDDSIYQLSITTGKPPSYFTGKPEDDASFRKRYGDELPTANEVEKPPTVSPQPPTPPTPPRIVPEGPKYAPVVRENVIPYHSTAHHESHRKQVQDVYVSVLKIQSAVATVASELAKLLIDLEGK